MTFQRGDKVTMKHEPSGSVLHGTVDNTYGGQVTYVDIDGSSMPVGGAGWIAKETLPTQKFAVIAPPSSLYAAEHPCILEAEVRDESVLKWYQGGTARNEEYVQDLIDNEGYVIVFRGVQP